MKNITRNIEEQLYLLYRATVRDEQDEEPDHAFEPAARNGNLQVPDQQILGSLRVLRNDLDLIEYVVLEKNRDGGYLVLKTSTFIDFKTPWDYVTEGSCGDLMVEMDNEFVLSPDEVMRSIPVGVLDALELMELAEARNDILCRDLKPEYGISAGSYAARFRIDEHDLTLPFRCRTEMDHLRLWIPQLEFDDMGREVCNRMVAHSETVAQAFAMLKQPPDCKIFYAPTHTLQIADNGAVILIPAPELINRLCEVHCGAFRVYHGYLPSTLLLANHTPLGLPELQEALDIRVNRL